MTEDLPTQINEYKSIQVLMSSKTENTRIISTKYTIII